MKNSFRLGIDIGSTTVKVVVCRDEGDILFSRYRRHHALTLDTVRTMLEEALTDLGNVRVSLGITGSAGLGISESYGFPFLQEVVASSRLIRRKWPTVKTFIEIGGEDSKVIFFDHNAHPDMRMNGSCAGGTGAFIDQMATLLNVSIEDFDQLARHSTSVYPIASRCGVFAKTDIQSLLSNHVPKEDIAASVFHAVALQVAASLLKGKSVEEKVLFAGGPLGFFPGLRLSFMRVLNLTDNNVVVTANPELIAASGAALYNNSLQNITDISECLKKLEKKIIVMAATEKLSPLFSTDDEFSSWEKRHQSHVVEKADLRDADGKECFLGIDSGSTTTKMVLMDGQRRVLLSCYGPNNGDPVEAVRAGLHSFGTRIIQAGVSISVTRSAVTGYGEDLIKAAFSIDDGVVETIAHFKAASAFSPDVSFILDIGGQDMKAIFIDDHTISDIQINEACSSGCGSFIETFARSLNYDVASFAELACESSSPFDLGTRCTVFMNSKIKQAQREGAAVPEISAGLAYAVVKNSLYKVLKLNDVGLLGDNIVVQGGTFRNPAVLRAFEILTGKNVVRPDIAELMGAYGAAITACDNYHNNTEKSSFTGFLTQPGSDDCRRDIINCRGCENRCPVTRLSFSNGRKYYTGNRCENSFSNNPRKGSKGINMAAIKTAMLFDRNLLPAGKPILSFGIPRALNFFANFPFWSTYLTSCGFEVVLSSQSTTGLLEKGIHTVMSDNICFPGKLVHGHIFDLMDKKVDRIFYPNVIYEQKSHTSSWNSYNCPVVTGYPDIIRSSIDPLKARNIPLDSPTISFKSIDLLRKQLYSFVKQFGVSRSRSAKALAEALAAQTFFKKELIEKGGQVLNEAEAEGWPVVVLSGRPYHIDPLVNHGIPELLTALGVHVLTEDSLPLDPENVLKENGIMTQWEYANRILAAAEYVGTHKNVRMVQLTSFGCGLDALSADESRNILTKKGHPCTVIKIDEITNLGAVKIRLRSLLEAVSVRDKQRIMSASAHVPSSVKSAKKTILIPWISPFYSPLLPPLSEALGLKVETLPLQDRSSVELGLRHVNNDVCYPAVIIIGDLLKALQSGKYKPEETAFFYAQTFGQCRASNYLNLARKALNSAGYGAVETFSFSVLYGDTGGTLPVDRKESVKRFIMGIVFADALARLYYATAPREINKGEAKRLHGKYIQEIANAASQGNRDILFTILRKAVTDFNNVEMVQTPVPAVGILGEIYVMYNAFANNNIMEWFLGQGVEVTIPPVFSFFTQDFVNERFLQGTHLKKSFKDMFNNSVMEYYINRFLGQVEKVMSSFRYYRKPHSLSELAGETSKVASLANQAGEGWLLTAEMISMLHSGVKDIVCMQPFGCLANHVTGKGISQRLKEFYPELNLLFLDMDAGHSEVNLLNRLHFMNLRETA